VPLDSTLFFGRTVLIQKLYDAMSNRSFTVVLGASGSGKSSLVKAGLIPHLGGQVQTQQVQKLKPQEDPSESKYSEWQILAPFRPGESPLKSLNGILKELGGSNISSISQLDSRIFTEAIAAWSQAHPNTRLLLTIDQFEELITLCHSDQERQQFLNILAELLKAYPEVLRLVVTLRSDFEPQLRNTPLEYLWQPARFVVPAMNREELREVIEEPASAKVVYFESLDSRGDLVDQLIDEVAGMPGALPLLSFALSELYLKLVRRYLVAQKNDDAVERAITWVDYDDLGGVTKSLTRRADEIYDELVKSDPSYERTIRHVMLRMVAIGSELARRQVPENELKYPEPENTRVIEVISKFSSARLLVSGVDSNDNSYVEPAHDALVRGWKKLRDWKTAEEENLILQRRLTPAAVEWDIVNDQDKSRQKGILDRTDPVLNWLDRKLFTIENLVNKIPAQFIRLLRRSQNQPNRLREKPEQFLWDSNPYLRLLDEKLHTDDNWLNQVEREFIQESVLQKRRNISWRWRIAIGVMLGLSGLSISTLYQLKQAQRQRVEQLAANSEALAGSQPVDAVINAIAAKVLSQSAFVQFLDRSQFSLVEDSLINVIPNNQEQNRMLHESWVNSVNYSPDGKYIVSGSYDKTIRIWDAKTGILVGKPFQGHQDGVTSVVYSPDGKRIASGSRDYSARIWDTKTGTLIGKPLQHGDNTVISVVYSPDGKRIVSGNTDNTLRIWDTKTGILIGKPLQGHEDKVISVAYSPDGKRIVSGSADHTLRIWDANTGTLIGKPLIGHENNVMTVAYSPDGNHIASGSLDEGVQIWDASTGTPIDQLTLRGHIDGVNSIAYSPDGKRIVSGSWDKIVRIWDASTGALICKLSGHEDKVISVAYSPDGEHIVSGSYDKTVRIWDAIAPNCKPLQGHEKTVQSVAYSPDGKRIVSGSWDKTVRIWDANTGLPIGKPLQGHMNAVSSVAYSPDGKRIVSGSWDKTVRIWDANTGLPIGKPLQGHMNLVSSVAYSPDGKRIVSGSSDNTIRIWDANTGILMDKPLQGHKKTVQSVAYSPDGKHIVSSSSDKMIRIWDANTGMLMGKPLQGSEGVTTSVVYSQDGKRIVSGNTDFMVRIWDVNTGLLIGKPLQGHGNTVYSVAFSPDGKRIASSSADKTVRIWDVNTGLPIGKPLQGHEDGVYSVAFSPDGKRIISSSADKTIRIWDISWKSLLPMACNQLRYHPSLNQPTTDVAREAKQTCKQYTDSSTS
jgi:WD40 repeat protein/energy-coupling factor transporter ATP-binding protein EcfA2